MSRFGGFALGMALVAGVTNYGVKQMVQSTANELAAVQRKTIVEQKEIHELNADWTYLNQPELLADLNKRYIGLVPMSPKQVGALIDNIPLRPAPPPPPEPAPQIAAGTPPPMPVAASEPIIPAASAPGPAALQIVAAVAMTAASAPVSTPIVRAVATPPARSAARPSLDALFAQVAGDR